MDRARSHLALIGVVLLGALGCQGRSAAVRREADRATAEAESRAQEATITSAAIVPAPEEGDDATTAAFRLEQYDYRGRLSVALDQLDKAVLHSRASRDLRARRALLKADLEAVERSTETDWATLRTKLERDLEPRRQ